MLVEDNTSEHVTKLIATLEALIASSSRRVGKKYEFLFVSQAQAKPFTVAFANWERRGRAGPLPEGTPAEFRAALYAQAETASELKAFVIVTSVMIVELAEVAIVGLRDGRIVLAYTVLRGLIERIALAAWLSDTVATIKSVPQDKSLTPVLELHEVIHKALYGTQREWSAVIKADLRQASPKTLNTFKRRAPQTRERRIF